MYLYFGHKDNIKLNFSYKLTINAHLSNFIRLQDNDKKGDLYVDKNNIQKVAI